MSNPDPCNIQNEKIDVYLLAQLTMKTLQYRRSERARSY